ncbi:MAG: NAD(P)-binding protein [Candidatus Nanoarchaeia archaeon]
MATQLLQQSKKILTQAKVLVGLIVAILLIGTIGFGVTMDMQPTGAFVTTLHLLAKGAPPELELTGAAAWLETFLHLLGAIIIWFAVWTAFDLTIEGKFGEVLKEVKTMNQIRNLHNHYIICGVGRVGKHIGERLEKAGKTVVYIEKDKDTVTRLRSKNALVIDVGPIDGRVLADAGIQNAEGIAVSLGDDGKNLLLVLEARELNPNIRIAARVNDAKLVPKFKRAGADYIILPEALGGIKLADALMGAVDSKHVFIRE